jgi:hypothetical protein
MTRAIAAMPIAMLAFVLALALAASAISTGLVPQDSIALWAAAVMAGNGDLSIGAVVAAYPSVPFLATALLELATPAGTPTPALLSAALLALIAGLWFNLLRSKLPLLFAIAATLLLALHPMLLRAAVAGPAEIVLAAFLFLFGNALYDLRSRTAIPEVMTAGLALLGIAFSHPIGAAMAIVAIPFLAFTVRPILVAGSAVSIVLTLAFPALFGAMAFTYVSWVFPGDGWRFFASTDGAAGWIASLGAFAPGGFSGLRALDAGLMIAAVLLLAAPLAAVAVGWVHRRRPLVAPALVFTAITLTAAMLAVATGLFGSPLTVTVAAPVLAAIVLLRVPIEAYRRPMAMVLLLLGFSGGALGLALIEPRNSMQLDAALNGRTGDQERSDTLALGGATDKRDGILVDIFNAPAIVLGRGHSSGLLLPSGEPFTIALLFSRVQAPFVAVPDPQSAIGAADRLNKAFPLLYRDGPPGYRLIYQNNTWRLFARVRDDDVYQN